MLSAAPSGLKAEGATQEPIWTLSASTTSLELGDTVVISGSLRTSPELDLALERSTSSAEAFLVSSYDELGSILERGSRIKSFKLSVIPAQVGKIPLATTWVAKGMGEQRFNAPPVELHVREPPLDPQGNPRPIKEPLAARPALWPWILLAAACAAAYASWRRFKRRQGFTPLKAAAADPRPPQVVAEEELARLEASGLWERGLYKEFYSALSEILRQYLERRCRVPATRLTSSELFRHLRQAELDRGVVQALKEGLSRADLVKFAKTRPDQDWGPADLAAARRIVHETAPRDLALKEAGKP
ncbi:MAG: hypothetical protein HY921_09710 [Elusimicrobia bacterium]|nr:hypothetical protein [Elusimicrobiota bacterium]